jgi:ribosomal-protein-alanine N-acetyltransferase
MSDLSVQLNVLTLIEIKHLTLEDLPAAVELDRLCFGGLWTLDGYRRELESPNSDLLGLWIEGKRKKEEGKRKKEEGKRKKEEGKRKKEEGRGEEEEGRGEEEEGRGEEEEGISRAVSFSNQKEIFGRGSAPVPALNPNGATTEGLLEHGATTAIGLPLQENETAPLFPSLIGLACLWAILGEGHITMLGIHPNYQGRGLGKTLLYSLLKLAHQRQLEWATLEVRASNLVAISLYQKFGFKAAGRRRGYYQEPEEDALILWRSGLQQPEFEQDLVKWEKSAFCIKTSQ